MAHPLTGTWGIRWSQAGAHAAGRVPRHNVHQLSMGVLPMCVYAPKVTQAWQIVDVEDGWVSDVADLEFDDGYRARWTARGDIASTLLETETPIQLDVGFESGKLVSLDGTPPDALALHCDRKLSMKFRRAQSTVLVLTPASRVDRDRFKALAMLTRL